MSNTDDLLQALIEIDEIQNEAWMKSLSDRKKKELEFHDKDRDRTALETMPSDTYDKFYGNRKYYTATKTSKTYVDNWIDTEAEGKVFLDYACGNGFQAINAAKAGAHLAIGIDISPISIQNAKEDAEKAGVSENTFFVQADAENTMLPECSVDRILCSGMLHHLDLSYAFPELRRVLVPGGKVLAVEALDYNPAIKVYRYLTPAMRTDWEKAHILSLSDVKFARRFFDVDQIKYWHVLGILSPHMKFAAGALEMIDNVITKIPLIKMMAWIFTFEMIKRKED